MKTRDTVAVILLSVVATGAIGWLSLRGEVFVTISLRTQDTSHGKILTPTVVAKADGTGVVFFDFAAEVAGSASDRLTLEVRANPRPDYVKQGDYPVDAGVVRAVVQLGSPEWPLRESALYSFRLRDGEGRVVLDGDISAQAVPLAAPQAVLVAWIGLLASVLQVVIVFWDAWLVRGAHGAPPATAQLHNQRQEEIMSVKRSTTNLCLGVAAGLLALTVAASAQSRSTELTGRLGASSWGSGYLDLAAPVSLKAGDEIQLLVGGNARKVLVRALQKGSSPDSPVGIIGGPVEVPSNRIVRVTLSSPRDSVVQISVHGGENPWGQIPLGTGNGPATLLRVERVTH